MFAFNDMHIDKSSSEGTKLASDRPRQVAGEVATHRGQSLNDSGANEEQKPSATELRRHVIESRRSIRSNRTNRR